MIVNKYLKIYIDDLKYKQKGDHIMEYVTLNNGLKMPMVGFGVFRVPDKKECEESVYQAIKAGYRLIDTAAAYYNEDAVGAAVKRAIAVNHFFLKKLQFLFGHFRNPSYLVPII